MTSGGTVPTIVAMPRPDLLARLDAAVRGKVTVVAAPAGWGKSVLLQQWASSRDARSAIARVEFDGDGRTPSLQSFSATLARLASLPDAYLVLDDIDRLDPAAQDAVETAIDTAPELHVVVASRSVDVFASLTRALRRRDEVAYVGTTELAFDRDAARAVIEEIAGRHVDDGSVDALVHVTEGWPVALACAARSLHDTLDDAQVVVARFGADDPYFDAYFRDELLADRDPELTRFMMETSVLDELNHSLCDAVTGRTDSADMLRRLAGESLLVPDGDKRRYSRLWRAALLRELRATDPDAEPRLLRTAADWYAEHEDVDAEARCLIGARDWDAVLMLAFSYGRAAFERARVNAVLDWIDAVPPDRRADPQVVLQHATLLTMVGRTHAAQAATRALGPVESLPLPQRAVVDTLNASWVEHHVPPHLAVAAVDDADRCLDGLRGGTVLALDSTPASLRTIAHVYRARARWYLADVATARANLLAELADGDPYPPWQINALGALALLESWSGSLTAAARYARHALRVAADVGLGGHPSTIDATLAMSHVLRERFAFDHAATVLADAYDKAVAVQRRMSLAIHAVEAGHLALSMSVPERGLAHLRRFRLSGQGTMPLLIQGRLRAVEAQLLLACGDARRAEQVLRDVPNDTAEVAAVAAALALVRGDTEAAQAVVTDWPAEPELQAKLQRMLWTAIGLDARGRRADAVEAMAALVERAEPEGHVALFVDAGADAQRLVRALFHAEPTPYLRSLTRPSRPVPLSTDGEHRRAVLSDRERAVLRYLPSRRTNAEIAKALFLSENTVKSHVRSIYNKLDVRGRTEAVRRAEDLGLV